MTIIPRAYCFAQRVPPKPKVRSSDEKLESWHSWLSCPPDTGFVCISLLKVGAISLPNKSPVSTPEKARRWPKYLESCTFVGDLYGIIHLFGPVHMVQTFRGVNKPSLSLFLSLFSLSDLPLYFFSPYIHSTPPSLLIILHSNN